MPSLRTAAALLALLFHYLVLVNAHTTKALVERATSTYDCGTLSSTTTLTSYSQASSLGESCSYYDGSIRVMPKTKTDIDLNVYEILGDLIVSDFDYFSQATYLNVPYLTFVAGDFSLINVTGGLVINGSSSRSTLIKRLRLRNWNNTYHYNTFLDNFSVTDTIEIVNTTLAAFTYDGVDDPGIITISGNPLLRYLSLVVENATSIRVLNNATPANYSTITINALKRVGNMTITGSQRFEAAKLETIDGNLDLCNNSFPNVTLNNMKSVGGMLRICGNQNMSLLDMRSLSRVTGDFRVENNSILTSLTTLNSLDTTGRMSLNGPFVDVSFRSMPQVHGPLQMVSTANMSCAVFDRLASSQNDRKDAYSCKTANETSTAQDHETSGGMSLPTNVKAAIGVTVSVVVVIVAILGIRFQRRRLRRQRSTRNGPSTETDYETSAEKSQLIDYGKSELSGSGHFAELEHHRDELPTGKEAQELPAKEDVCELQPGNKSAKGPPSGLDLRHEMPGSDPWSPDLNTAKRSSIDKVAAVVIEPAGGETDEGRRSLASPPTQHSSLAVSPISPAEHDTRRTSDTGPSPISPRHSATFQLSPKQISVSPPADTSSLSTLVPSPVSPTKATGSSANHLSPTLHSSRHPEDTQSLTSPPLGATSRTSATDPSPSSIANTVEGLGLNLVPRPVSPITASADDTGPPVIRRSPSTETARGATIVSRPVSPSVVSESDTDLDTDLITAPSTPAAETFERSLSANNTIPAAEEPIRHSTSIRKPMGFPFQ